MTPERQRLAEDIFKAVVAAPVQNRRALARERCGSDTALHDEVWSLMAFAEEETGPLDETAPRLAGIIEPDDAAGLLPPDRKVGHYSIVRVLGIGGMGVVYVAQQARPSRTVALKLIRPGLATPSVLRRLEYEAELLGRLQHPGIAQIIESGTADAGFGLQPYFAMELVDGLALTKFCDEKSLSPRERVSLFARICDAIEHAHQRGVIHRDLKPGNILVDRSGQPKVLDFGVARAIQGREGQQQLTMMGTGERQLIGTLAYMSPEQVTGDPLQVDTRADIYALGVILFELLAGSKPHDVESRSLPDALRVIRDEDPQRLGKLNPACRGDLEIIAAKALAKDKTRRYQSAAELAGDARRFLKNEPITARPPSTIYQLGKFTKRHKALAAGVAAASLALLVGLIGTSYGFVQARSERDKAVRAQKNSQVVLDFVLQDMIARAAPGLPEEKDLTVKQAVIAAAKLAPSRFADDPESRMHVLWMLGKSIALLGDYASAEHLIRQAIAAGDEFLSPGSEDRIDLLHDLSTAIDSQGKHADAIVCRNQAMALAKIYLPPSNRVRLSLEAKVAIIHQSFGGGEDVEAELKSAIAAQESAGLTSNVIYRETQESLAEFYMSRGRIREALDYRREILALTTERRGPEHAETVKVAMILARTLSAQGYTEEAASRTADVLTLMERVYDADAPVVIDARLIYADSLFALQRDSEGAEQAKQAYQAGERVFSGARNMIAIAQIQVRYALCLKYEGKHAEARDMMARGVAAVLDQFGPTDKSVVFYDAMLGCLMIDAGEVEPGIAKVRAAIESMSQRSQPAPRVHLALGQSFAGIGRWDEALAEFQLAYEQHLSQDGPDHPRPPRVASQIAALLHRAGRDSDAARWTERGKTTP